MICLERVKQFCKDDYTKIKNYDKAMADTEHTWECHHILELTLDNEYAHSRAELIRFNMYYKRPYFELIFLPCSEHVRLHATNRSASVRKKISEFCRKNWTGRKHSKETKEKMSRTRMNHEGWNAGKHMYNNGVKNIFSRTCPEGFRPGWIKQKLNK